MDDPKLIKPFIHDGYVYATDRCVIIRETVESFSKEELKGLESDVIKKGLEKQPFIRDGHFQSIDRVFDLKIDDCPNEHCFDGLVECYCPECHTEHHACANCEGRGTIVRFDPTTFEGRFLHPAYLLQINNLFKDAQFKIIDHSESGEDALSFRFNLSGEGVLMPLRPRKCIIKTPLNEISSVWWFRNRSDFISRFKYQ
jgi:hypothetical protein